MIKIFVLDTNTLISAHLIKNSIPRLVLQHVLDHGVLVQSNNTFLEFAEKFAHSKFDKYLSIQSRVKAINFLESNAIFISIEEEVIACRDPKDDKFLSLAWNSNADYLISGDKDLLVLHPFRSTPILSPIEFLEKHTQTDFPT